MSLGSSNDLLFQLKNSTIVLPDQHVDIDLCSGRHHCKAGCGTMEGHTNRSVLVATKNKSQKLLSHSRYMLGKNRIEVYEECNLKMPQKTKESPSLNLCVPSSIVLSKTKIRIESLTIFVFFLS